MAARFRFMVKDLCELRANNWTARRKKLVAKTKEEIRKEAQREEAEKNRKMKQGGRYGGRQQQRRPHGGGRNQNTMGGIAFNSRMGSSGGYRLGQKQPGGRSRQGGARSSNSSNSNNNRRLGPQSMNAGRGLRNRSPVGGNQQQQTPKQETPKMNADKMKQRIEGTLKEFMSIKDVREVCETLKELAPQVENVDKMQVKFVDTILGWSIEKNKGEMDALPPLLVAVAKEGIVSTVAIAKACSEMFEFLDDIKIDSPKCIEQFGCILGQWLTANVLPKDKLKDALKGGLDQCGDSTRSMLGFALQKAGVNAGEVDLSFLGGDVAAFEAKYMSKSGDPTKKIQAMIRSSSTQDDILQYMSKTIDSDAFKSSLFAVEILEAVLDRGAVKNYDRLLTRIIHSGGEDDVTTSIQVACIRAIWSRGAEADAILRELYEAEILIETAFHAWSAQASTDAAKSEFFGWLKKAEEQPMNN